MQVVVYDGTFEGLLTAVFEVYEYKFIDASITKENEVQASAFGDVHFVNTDATKAERVMKGLEQKISRRSLNDVYRTFLSELPGIENTLLRYMKYIFGAKALREHDYSHPDVLMIRQTSNKVYREKHRMEAFVRFQLTADQLYYAIVQPDYNVLPLVGAHFKERYADQRWLIYDARRKYGIYYDLEKLSPVNIAFNEGLAGGTAVQAVYDESEALYQLLWQQYFSSVNIAARKNMRLHLQRMPARYWKYLVEKLS
ncbi:MAG TPA: TIGR03915 family putative DNA repair protein [Chitinophagaceae bacterium]|nr:TIGR03915 family putative DNA repair protein [Chitinophagaceae bacterium]